MAKTVFVAIKGNPAGLSFPFRGTTHLWIASLAGVVGVDYDTAGAFVNNSLLAVVINICRFSPSDETSSASAREPALHLCIPELSQADEAATEQFDPVFTISAR